MFLYSLYVLQCLTSVPWQLKAGTGIAELIALEVSKKVLLPQKTIYSFFLAQIYRAFLSLFDHLILADKHSSRRDAQENLACGLEGYRNQLIYLYVLLCLVCVLYQIFVL